MSDPLPAIRPAALVTGGAIRLGKAIALALAGAGFDIALHYNSSEAAAQETAGEIEALGVRCVPFRADLGVASDFSDLIGQVAMAFPRLELLVNSASGYTQATIAESDPAMFDRLFALNLRAPFFLSRAFAQRVGAGSIVNIIDNKIGFHQFKYAAYLLTKQSLAEFTRMAALEFAPRIRVNGVAPGVVAPMSSRSDDYLRWRIQGIPLQRKGETHHITRAILHLVENDFINGQVLVVDGGENILHTGRNAGEFDQAKV